MPPFELMTADGVRFIEIGWVESNTPVQARVYTDDETGRRLPAHKVEAELQKITALILAVPEEDRLPWNCASKGCPYHAGVRRPIAEIIDSDKANAALVMVKQLRGRAA